MDKEKKGRKLSDEVINQIPVLYNELKNKSEVARTLGISVASVNKYLTLLDAAPEVKRKKRVVVTPELIEQINETYSKEKNVAATAKKLGISDGTVRKYLSEDNKKIKQQQYDDRDALWFYIYRLFGPESEEKPVSDKNLYLMSKYQKEGMPYRGQLLTLKYFYEIKKHSLEKSNGGIGIIPYIFSEAAQYYAGLEAKQKEITEIIQRQLEKDRIEIKYNPSDYINKKRKKKEIDLNSI